MNNVCLTGRLAADPDLKFTPSGKPVCAMRLAVNRRYNPNLEKQEADFFNLVAFDKTAEYAANNFEKGMLLEVQGTLRDSSYTARDGTKKYRVEVWVNNANRLSKPKDQGQAAPPRSKTNPQPAPPRSKTNPQPAPPQDQLPDDDSFDPFENE